MSKNYILVALISLLFPSLTFTKNIKAICVDIEILFETDDMRAANYVGKIDSLRYLRQVGHLPCQQDLFSKLTNVPAGSTIFTYNNELKMPLIFSDWLLNLSSIDNLLRTTLYFIDHAKLSDIEKTIFGNIVKMMFTPASLADIQKVIQHTNKLLITLKKQGYDLYLTGNWTNILPLQQRFNSVLQLFDGIFISGKLHLLKPEQQYYQAVLDNINLDPSEVLWIEKEKNFAAKVKDYNLNIIRLSNPNHPKTIAQDLKTFGINI